MPRFKQCCQAKTRSAVWWPEWRNEIVKLFTAGLDCLFHLNRSGLAPAITSLFLILLFKYSLNHINYIVDFLAIVLKTEIVCFDRHFGKTLPEINANWTPRCHEKPQVSQGWKEIWLYHPKMCVLLRVYPLTIEITQKNFINFI